ncbi:MAG: Branched-chain amino acid transport system permease protein LivM [Anaerolineae bacterium]|nr:MAG: Branched-chain amino acid transport system permease protein LivM [Anaerolineae bacterium]
MMKLDRQTLGFWIVLLGLIILVQILVSAGILSPFWETLLKIGAVMSIVSLGLNLIYGFNGQFSLGQWGFYAIGAYAAADVTYRWAQMKNASGLMVLLLVVLLVGGALFLIAKLVSRMRGLDPLSAFALYIVGVLIAAFLGVQLGNQLINPVTQALSALPPGLAMQIVYLLAVLLGGFLAAEVSYLFGLPVLTLGSDYFGIATLGFTIIVKVLLDNSDTLLGFEEMKGARGMVGIPKTTSWLWVALFLILVIILLRNLLHSSYGRAIVSVREDEIAAKAMGIDVAQQKTFAFVLGSFLAGLAGGLYAHINGFLHPNTFNFIKSFDPMIIVVFGGLGSVSGTIMAAFTWALVLEGFLRILLPAGFETWRFVVYPLFLLVMMLLRPQGLFGGFEFPYLRQILPKPYVPRTQEQIALVHAVEEAPEGD